LKFDSDHPKTTAQASSSSYGTPQQSKYWWSYDPISVIKHDGRANLTSDMRIYLLRAKYGSLPTRDGSLSCVWTITNVLARQTLSDMRFGWSQRNIGDGKGPAHGVSTWITPIAAAGSLTRVVVEI